MSLMRNFVFTLARSRFAAMRQTSLRGKKQNLLVGFVACRFISTHHVTKNIEVISEDSLPSTVLGKSTEDGKLVEKPLLVLLSWLMAQPKHVMKFANLYLEQGFDVVHVSATPWQMMWPVKGTRPIAYDLLQFLEQHSNYQQIMLHGFSVAGYMWGEIMTYVHQDRKRYDPIIEKIVGQVWDSAVDVTELCIGVPRAVFLNNAMMQKVLEKYLEYHLKTFYNQATQYYIRSSQMFHTNLVRAPALFLLSNTDPVGSVASNMRVRDSWDAMGTPTYVKVFDKSPHVGHFRKYPKEYTHEIYTFLNMLKMVKDEDKLRARIQN